MKASYYYIVSGLPNLMPEDRVIPFTATDLKAEIAEQLEPEDQQWLGHLFLPIDNRNLLRIIRGKAEEFENGGMYNLEALQTGLSIPETLLPYMQEFIGQFKGRFEDIADKDLELALLNAFVNWQVLHPFPFLREWFSFEANVNNLLVALNCREHKIDPERQVAGDYSEAEQIRTSKERDFKLSGILPYLETVMASFEHPNLQVREYEIAKLKWETLESMAEPYYFTIEWLLSYTLKLRRLERRAQLSDDLGESRIRSALSSIRKEFTLPEQFAINPSS